MLIKQTNNNIIHKIILLSNLNLNHKYLRTCIQLFFITFLLLATIPLAKAATYTVTKTANTNDGVCNSDCSLNEALGAANATADDDIINFSALFNSVQTITANNSITGASASGGGLIINGPGRDLLTIQGISGPANFPIILGDTTSSAQINNLTLLNLEVWVQRPMEFNNVRFLGDRGSNPSNPQDTGRGIYINPSSINGSATVNNSIIEGHSAGQGGGIQAFGNLMLNNSTIQNNLGGFNGGGIYIGGNSTVTITNSTISNNGFGGNGSGGGIYSDGFTVPNNCSLTITNSNINNNSASGTGGGIFNQRCELNISGSTIDNNTAGSTGGINNTNSTTTITNTDIINNSTTSSSSEGGGISVINNDGNSRTVSITDSLIDNNSANNRGGGIEVFVEDLTLNLTNVTISNNNADADNTGSGEGGGIYSRGTVGSVNLVGSTVDSNSAVNGGGIRNIAPLSIENSTISNNSAEQDGGGILNLAPGFGLSTISLTNSTISSNTADGSGGGVFNRLTSNDGDIDMFNSTIANNTADFNNDGVGNGGGVFNETLDMTFSFDSTNSIFANNTDNNLTGNAPDFSGTLNSQGYNLVENTTGTTISGITTGNITGQDPMLGVLANYGGSTQTHTLLTGSPAIDKGSAVNVPIPPSSSIKSRLQKSVINFLPPLTKDQRGFIRPNDIASVPNATGGDGSDIGAVEILGPTSANASISGRVMINNGRGLSRTVVEMTDSSGYIRYVRTNQFGYYRFEDVQVGETYIFNVYSKQYQFSPRIINLDNSLTDLNFTPN